MSEPLTLLALFGDVDPASNGIAKLKELGVHDAAINVISGLPFPARALGRPSSITKVSNIAMAGSILGGAMGLFLLYGTAYFYPLHVGGQPIYPVPMAFIATFEMAMLGLMGFAFLGLFVDSGFPSYTPKQYVPQISDGKVAVLFECERADERRLTEGMKQAGAESVQPAEARHL